MIRAVIIDDDMTTIHGLEKSVPWEDFGIELAGTAMNGREGLEQIELHRPDLILTDIFMPVMDGIEMLKEVREQGNAAEVIILSGYEDFKYAQSAVKLQVNDYLSKPATLGEIGDVVRKAADKIRRRTRSEQEERELRELLQLHLPETRKQLFKGLLEPQFCETAFFRKVSGQLRLSFDRQYFTVVMLEYAVTRERTDYRPSDLPKFSYAVQNIVEEMSQSRNGVYVADVQPNVITLIMATPSDVRSEYVKSRVKQSAREYMDNIRDYLKLQVWASVGTPAASVRDIPGSYREAMNLLAERDSLGEAGLICEEELRGRPKTALRRPMESYQAIVDAVVNGQSDLVGERIRELTDSLGVQAMPVGALRELAIDLMGVLTMAMYDHGLQLEDVHPGIQLYKDIERLCSVRDFAAWLCDVLLPVSEAMSRRGTHKHRKTVDFIMRYVQEHYAEDITLDVIADKVFLTRNYLSQIFKQVTGENYNNYVTRVRMEKAKELMMSGKYKLYEIALMVGYKNNAYFSQQFKKYTGFNPSEFST